VPLGSVYCSWQEPLPLRTRASPPPRTAATSKWEQRRKLYPDLVRIFDLAEGAPAPLRAFALLRIAALPRLRDTEWKRELVNESFEAAAKFPTSGLCARFWGELFVLECTAGLALPEA